MPPYNSQSVNNKQTHHFGGPAFFTWKGEIAYDKHIAPRSEEERIEEFLEENDALLKNQDKIPFKYISDIHYGKKTVWKNPDFEN